MGLMDMGDDSDGGDGVDADLEDELNKLMFGGSKTNKPKKTKGEMFLSSIQRGSEIRTSLDFE